MESASKVILVRHAESEANHVYRKLKEQGDIFASVKFNEELIDCSITSDGIQQAQRAAAILKPHNIKIVITSPLQRCLQTTKYIFKDHPSNPRIIVEPLISEMGDLSSSIPKDLKQRLEDFSDFDFSALDKFPDKHLWFFETMIEETLKEDLLKELKKQFPTVEEQDEKAGYWFLRLIKENPAIAETHLGMLKRVATFRQELESRVKELKEGEKLAVVGHSQFLRMLTAKEFNEVGKPLDGKHFTNCEAVEFDLKTNEYRSLQDN
jgi:Fructose-2,6-bisphosphatase